MNANEMKAIDQIPYSAIRDIENCMRNYLDKCGLYYRLFGRVKSAISTSRKFEEKMYSENHKMQDLVGFRIALYFQDDIRICEEIIRMLFAVDNVSHDTDKVDKFKPTRLNYVCKIPSEFDNIDPSIFIKYPIDNTFEIQIRTVFSEGWHEVEHDLRYKCQADWVDHTDLSRAFNGILATLVTCDWAIVNLFDNLSYRHYKKQEWKAMMTNKLRIRICDSEIRTDILDILNANQEIAKQFLKFDREDFILFLSRESIVFPLNINNIIFSINGLYIGEPLIDSLTPKAISEIVSMQQIQKD